MARQGRTGIVGRVAGIDETDMFVWVAFGGNSVAGIPAEVGPPVTVGDYVLVTETEFFLAPAEVLGTDDGVSVGVVRLRDEERTLIDGPAGLEWVPTTSSVKYEPWQTVEYNAKSGVTSLVSSDPIRRLDNPPPTVTIRSQFHVPPGMVKETFANVAGLDDEIKQLQEIIDNLKNPEAFEEAGAKPVRGVLFAGPSGTGKTHLARALANEAGAEFFQVRGPEVTSKWVNESEEILRALFDHAKQCERAIIFFDEIDSIASSRSSSSHEMSNRLVTQLLTLMDGFIESNKVVVIGATNRPEELDPPLLRRGRFDWRIDFKLPDLAARRAILEVLAPKILKGPAPCDWLASNTRGWSGADLEGIWSEAVGFALREGRKTVRDEDCRIGYERVISRLGRTVVPREAAS